MLEDLFNGWHQDGDEEVRIFGVDHWKFPLNVVALTVWKKNGALIERTYKRIWLQAGADEG